MKKRSSKYRPDVRGNAAVTVQFIFLLLLVWNVGTASAMDANRYISIQEVKPGMEGYFLTVFSGQKIEKYPLEVIGVVKNWQPSRDSILVRAKDPLSEKVGGIAGCSGSPAYLDGRLAGALAATFSAGKEPLYFVTPIEYMLEIGTAGPGSHAGPTTIVPVTNPIDLKIFHQKYEEMLHRQFQASSERQGHGTIMPLVTSLPEDVCRRLSDRFAMMGFAAMPSGGGNADQTSTGTTNREKSFQPGGVIAVPLLSGDITMAATGTVTETVGDWVYAFGHSFTGLGPVELPISTGTVYVVVSTLTRSFKYSTPGEIVGALKFDENCGIRGQVGAQAKLVPLTIDVVYFNDPKIRRYDCLMAMEPSRSPMLVQSAISGAGMMQGTVPQEHHVSYRGQITIKGHSPIEINNVSSGRELMDLLSEAGSVVGMLINNRFARVEFESISFWVDVQPGDTQAAIESVEISDPQVKAGDTVELRIGLQTILSRQRIQRINLTIPDDLPPGSYEILVAGADEYEKYLRKIAMFRFTAYDLDTLIAGLKTILEIRRDRIFVTLTLPASGLAIEQMELPGLPATKALLMQDGRRTLNSQPLIGRVEKQIETGFVVRGVKPLKITVEPR